MYLILSLLHDLVQRVITHSTSTLKIDLVSGNESQKTPIYRAHSELWDVFSQYSGERWLCNNGTAHHDVCKLTTTLLFELVCQKSVSRKGQEITLHRHCWMQSLVPALDTCFWHTRLRLKKGVNPSIISVITYNKRGHCNSIGHLRDCVSIMGADYTKPRVALLVTLSCTFAR